jgi:hypothetical protein
MIKQYLFPVAFNVATFTFLAKVTFVFVILFVAGGAIHRQLLFKVYLVATGARSSKVLAQQWIFGLFGMIKQYFFPASFQMATFAFWPQCTFMLVIFFVAGNTGCLQLFLVNIAFVTAGTFQFKVFPAQWIFGLLGMIENDFFPAFLDMTGFALWSEIAFVLVVFFVARVTQLWGFFVLVINVTFLASDIGVFAQQLEVGFVVVKSCGFPVFFYVALGAIGSQAALMLVVLLVAIVTDRRCFAEFFGRDMAILALNFFIKMSAFKLEAGLHMVKFVSRKYDNFGIATFMLGMAVLAVFLFFHLSVKAVQIRDVFGDFLVAILTQNVLASLVKFLVTLGAFTFYFCMALNQFSGRQDVSNRIGMGWNGIGDNETA